MRPVSTPCHMAQLVSTQHISPMGAYLLSQRGHAIQVYLVWVCGWGRVLIFIHIHTKALLRFTWMGFMALSAYPWAGILTWVP